MRARPVLVLVLLVTTPLVGCTVIQTEDEGSSRCRSAPGRTLVDIRSGAGSPAVDRSITEIQRDGTLTAVSTIRADGGSDSILPARIGAFQNLTVAEVRAFLDRFDAADGTNDTFVNLAYRGTVPDEQFRDLCRALVEEFHGIEDWSGDGSVSHGARLVITASTQAGNHTATYRDTGGDPPEDFQRVVDALRRAEEAVETPARGNVSLADRRPFADTVDLELNASTEDEEAPARCVRLLLDDRRPVVTRASVDGINGTRDDGHVSFSILAGREGFLANASQGSTPLHLTAWGPRITQAEEITYAVSRSSGDAEGDRTVRLSYEVIAEADRHEDPPSAEIVGCDP